MFEKLISEAVESKSEWRNGLDDPDPLEPLYGLRLSQLPDAISLHVNDAVSVCQLASRTFGSIEVNACRDQEMVLNMAHLGVVTGYDLELHLSALLVLLNEVRQHIKHDETIVTWTPSTLWSGTSFQRLQSDLSVSEEWLKLVHLGKQWTEQAKLFIKCAEKCSRAANGSSRLRKLAFLDLHYGTGVFYTQTIGLDFAVWHNLHQYL